MYLFAVPPGIDQSCFGRGSTFDSNRPDDSFVIGESVDWFYSLPWGTIWIIDTFLLGVFAVFLVISGRGSLAAQNDSIKESPN
ncbi:MAG: hypothetical protein JWR60_532 [Polaromonas sp.]|nr:hypothetical protein [Polaromonas sp.]